MKIETSQLKQLILSGLENLDPVKVVTENFEPGRGTITISCFGKAWTAGWPAMDGQNVEHFFSSASADYLANCLCRGIPKHRYAEGDHADFIRKTVLEKRRAQEITPEQARESFERADGMSMNDVLADWNFESLWMPLFGDIYDAASADWPTELNPDYIYLCHIVEAVKNAFITISTQPVDEVKHDRNPVGEIVAWSGTNREMGITREIDFRFFRFDVKPGTKLYAIEPAPAVKSDLLTRAQALAVETRALASRIQAGE